MLTGIPPSDRCCAGFRYLQLSERRRIRLLLRIPGVVPGGTKHRMSYSPSARVAGCGAKQVWALGLCGTSSLIAEGGDIERYERASAEDRARSHPAVGPGALLQTRGFSEKLSSTTTMRPSTSSLGVKTKAWCASPTR